MRTRLRRAAVVVLLSAAGLLATAGPALAHSRLVSSNPADSTSLDTGPTQVSLTFNEDMPRPHQRSLPRPHHHLEHP